MADQIVITEKSSQAKDVRAAVGSRYGDILPAEGHLFDLLEPEDVVPAWKRWSPILLRPECLYGTRPAQGGNKAAKLKAIREALRTAKRVWLATDCDREGQLIGQEILEHYEYRGQVMRVLFTAQDSQTIRDAFGRAKPNAEYANLYAAAVARRQADQIYNLSLTRTATVILGQGTRRVIGVGRVKTPTLAIVCRRELEIRNFVPLTYFEVVATAKVAEGQFQMRHAPQERIVRREIAGALPMRPGTSRVRSLYASRINGKGHPSCMICLRCRNSAGRASAGRPDRGQGDPAAAALQRRRSDRGDAKCLALC
jgi:DNA topoisomerase III